MQASGRILAHRYAQALFETGVEHKDQDRISRDLNDAAKILRDYMHVFENPFAGASRQKTLLQTLIGPKISDRVLRFIQLLIDKKRFSLFPLIVIDYGAMVDSSRGVIRAQVRSAAKLQEAELTHLSRDLKKLFGKDVALETRETPELLGGMVVRIGDWVLDGSLQGKLRRLAAQLVEES